jgi:hypothetical protein
MRLVSSAARGTRAVGPGARRVVRNTSTVKAAPAATAFVGGSVSATATGTATFSPTWHIGSLVFGATVGDTSWHDPTDTNGFAVIPAGVYAVTATLTVPSDPGGSGLFSVFPPTINAPFAAVGGDFVAEADGSGLLAFGDGERITFFYAGAVPMDYVLAATVTRIS